MGSTHSGDASTIVFPRILGCVSYDDVHLPRVPAIDAFASSRLLSQVLSIFALPATVCWSDRFFPKALFSPRGCYFLEATGDLRTEQTIYCLFYFSRLDTLRIKRPA